jgi:hypothetical protein
MRDSGILRSFAVFAPQDDVRTIFSHGVGRQAGDAYARCDSKILSAPGPCSPSRLAGALPKLP